MKYKVTVMVVLFIGSSVFGQVKGLSGWNIILDPGHSQTENMGIYNYSEAEKNLRVAKALREYLLETTDIDTVYLTRTNDTEMVSLSQRTDYANSLGAAWYHSIHSDAGAPEKNSTLLLWGQYRSGQEKVPNGGKKMSSYMVDLLTRGMRTTTAGSYGDCTFYGCTTAGPYLHVNRMSTMPSELSEAGFHTSPLQNQRNMNAEWKRLEAWTLYWSILKHWHLARPAVRLLTGFVSDAENGESINAAKLTVDGQSYTTDSYQTLFHKYSSDPDQLRNGFYYFANLLSDSLTMIAEAPGYYPDTVQVALCDTFFTFKDVQLISSRPPFVESSSPGAGSDKFPAWDAITLRFSRPMDPASVETALSLTPAAAGRFTWIDGNRSVSFKPDTLDYEVEYTLAVSADAMDHYGHHLDGNQDGVAGDTFQLAFKTGPADLFPPRISSSLPKPNTQNVELQPIINMIYTEIIDSSSIQENSVTLYRNVDQAPVAGVLRHYVVGNQSVLSFFPSQTLSVNTVYKVQIEPGFKDRLGNMETVQKIFYFRTGTTGYQATAIDLFENGVESWLAPQQSGSTSGILTDKTAKNAEVAHVNLLSKSKTSMRLDYGWDVSAASWLIREYLNGGPGKSVFFSNSYILQAWVFGDGGKAQLRFCVDDRVPNYIAANHEVSPWYPIDWLGWKLVQWDLSQGTTGSWLGDGSLDGTLGFDSIQLTYQAGAAVSGTIYIDDLQVVKRNPTIVEETSSEAMPLTFGLLQNHPNPFNNETLITYRLAEKEDEVVIRIFDVTGRTVRTLWQQGQQAGEHALPWDGRDDHGHMVASGAYLYQLRTRTTQQTRQMVLTR